MIYICQRIPETDKANLAGRRRKKRSKLELTLLNFPRLPSVRAKRSKNEHKDELPHLCWLSGSS